MEKNYEIPKKEISEELRKVCRNSVKFQNKFGERWCKNLRIIKSRQSRTKNMKNGHKNVEKS